MLSVEAVKSTDAGLYHVEVSDVLGRHIGNMSLVVAVDLGCTASDACCEFPGVAAADGDTDGCPDAWENDGVCDRALCTHGDVHDCEGTAPSQPTDLCTNYAAFAAHLGAINSECCDQAEEDCSTGMPMICNRGCAGVLIPTIAACSGFLGSPDAGKSGVGVLAQLNAAAQRCSESGGGH